MANEFKIKNGYLSEGNSQITGSLNVSGGITGSLFGTSSYAITASYYGGSVISASYAVTASYATSVSTSISTQNLQHNVLFVDTSGPGNIQVDGGLRYNPNQDLLTTTSSYAIQALSASYAPSTPAFPFTGSATISGSLVVNQNATTQSLNTSTRTLFDSSSRSSVSWDNRGLVRSNGATSVDWENSTLKRSNITSLDWSDKITYDTSTSSSIKWDIRELWDADPSANGYNTASLDWNIRIAKDAGGVQAIAWGDRELTDNGGNSALNWKQHVLYTHGAISALNWSDDTYLDSNVYQRDFKSSVTQNTISNTYNNSYASYLGDVIEVDGITIFMDNTVTEGMLVYLNTNATWYPVDQASTVSTKLLGIAHNVAGNAGFILLEGHVVIDDTSTSGPNVQSPDHGLPIYIKNNTTTGLMSTVVPTTTGGPNIVRVLGHCYQQNSGTASQWMMKFRPSNDWVEI